MIHIDRLHKQFHGQPVLKGITLSIKKGEVVAVIGPSGTGKSTLLRCINYLETPDSGTICIDGHAVNAEKTSRRDIHALRKKSAMVFQSYNLFKNMTALENILAPLVTVQKRPPSEARETALEILKRVGLLEKQDSYPSKLSGGQQQRIAIGRAMAVNPRVMLFDEPTSALDPELVGEVLTVIRELAAAHTTMMIVTHEMNFAREVADRVVFMDDGMIASTGTPHEVLDNPDNMRVQKFLNKLSL